MDRFYQLLKQKYPQKSDVVRELINLEAIQHLPKGTEHFVSDLHGEYAAFDYILRNGSGAVKEKVSDCFREYGIHSWDLDDFCLYLYYPEEKLAEEAGKNSHTAFMDQLAELTPLLIKVVKFVGSKYTRSKLRKSFPPSFAYIIEELLTEVDGHQNKQGYFQAIISKMAQLNQLDDLVISLSYLIQRLVIDHLHVVGDIFDRGLYPDFILDRLEQLPSLDIQWGNHDVTWMGALSGSYLCMVNVIRIAARYNNLSLLEDRYGINLRPLVEYSQKYYQALPSFRPIIDEGHCSEKEQETLNIVQQATAILQFKLEHQLIDRRPEFEMNNRQLLNLVDYQAQTITINGRTYPLVDFNTSCISPQEPGQLQDDEMEVIKQLMHSFQSSERLSRHIQFLFEKGAMYRCYNNNLLFHGCIPLHSNGDFKAFHFEGKRYAGKALLDLYEEQLRLSYHNPTCHDDFATDLIWYLWAGEISSLFGKHAMTTFERYYIKDKTAHKEIKNPYYQLRNEETICTAILQSFGLGEDSHIINGHTPVKEKMGENPIKAKGKLIVIDGGFAKGYQKQTGLAGYTLVSNSFGLQLVAHQPFTNLHDVLSGDYDILSTKRVVDEAKHRILVKETTIGENIIREIKDLEVLYQHFDRY